MPDLQEIIQDHKRILEVIGGALLELSIAPKNGQENILSMTPSGDCPSRRWPDRCESNAQN